MLRSKATAALMRLKEMDKKYKMRCNEEAQLQSSGSTISAVDSIVDVPKHSIPGSGDTSGATLRPKLNIKMPPARVERAESCSPDREKESSTLVVTIFDKSIKSSHKANNSYSPSKITVQTRAADDRVGPAGEGNISDTLEITTLCEESRDEAQNMETSISEVVDEASRTVSELSRGVSNQISEDINIEITVESTTSVNAQLQIQNTASREISFATYSNDSFEATSSSPVATQRSHESTKLLETLVRSHSEEREKIKEHVRLVTKKIEVVSHTRYSSNWRSAEDESKQVVELLAPKVVNAVSECETGLDKELSNYAKTVEMLDVELSDSVTPVCLLKTSKPCSPRSKKYTRKQKSRAVKDIEESKSMESSSGSRRQKHSDASASRKKGNKRRSPNKSSPEIEIDCVPKLLPPYKHEKASNDETNFTPMDIAVLFTRKDEKIKNDEGIITSVASSMHESTSPEKNDRSQTLNNIRKEDSANAIQQESGNNSKKDIIRVLRSLNQEAIVAVTGPKVDRNEITKLPDRISFQSPRNYANHQMYKASAIQPVPVTRVTRVTEGLRSCKDTKLSLIDNCNDDNRHYNNDKTLKSKTNMKSSKSTKSRNAAKFTMDEKFLRYKSKDVDRLRAQMTALNLQQERDQLCNRVSGYMRQLEEERRRLMLCSTKIPCSEKTEPLIFKPLEFPKVTAFTRPESTCAHMKSKLTSSRDYPDVLRDRILEIRQWLKDQFILYRHCSTLVATINAKYIPTTLQDAKKMIRDMQTTSDGAR